MSSSTTQTTLNRRRLYRLTYDILNVNSLHFITFSLLFIPFTFSATAAVKFYFSSSPSISSPDFDVDTGFDPFNLFLVRTVIASSQNLFTVKTLITALAFTCLVILPTVAGVALITYSTHQAIYHTPLTFSSTLKSLSHSFIPLLHTVTAGSIKLIVLFLVFTLSPNAVTEAVKALGFRFDLLIYISLFINTTVSYALAITILFFIKNWGSAAAITVLESKSGFETLQQSANQSAEFREHSYSILFIAGFGIGTALVYSTVQQNSGPAANWIMIVRIGAVYLQSSLVMLLYVVANTVLYVQCKVASGEEIVKTAEEGEVSGEYVRILVVNGGDDEVFKEPANEKANGCFNYLLYVLTVVWMILLFATIFAT